MLTPIQFFGAFIILIGVYLSAKKWFFELWVMSYEWKVICKMYWSLVCHSERSRRAQRASTPLSWQTWWIKKALSKFKILTKPLKNLIT
jgi:hypothetical protein